MAQADLPGTFVHPPRVLTLVEGREEYLLGGHLEILKDPSHQLTINDDPTWLNHPGCPAHLGPRRGRCGPLHGTWRSGLLEQAHPTVGTA
jgi:hypothetical protein